MSIENITTPDFGGATDVTVIEILVKPGDVLKADAPIVTLESDKATMEVPTNLAGTVKEIKVKVGDKISSGDVLITLDSQGVKPSTAPALDATPEKKPEEKQSQPPAAVSQEKPKTERSLDLPMEKSAEQVHAGPNVRRFARELGVNLGFITGTGPKQRILKEDVQAYVKARLLQPQAASGFIAPTMPVIDFAKFGPVETQALSRIKKLTGKNLQRNWVMIPHVTQFGEADITALEAFRKAQKEEMEQQNIKLTMVSFIMKAVCAALKSFPTFNASLDATGENLILKNYCHIGVAVDTPEGLVVPVIRDVDKKGVMILAKELALISDKARKKQLTPQDMQGGSFSISSLGGIGGTAFTPIINAPEVAILGVSKASMKPVYQDKNFVPRLMLPLSLSYDHRVIDGAEAARFMVHLSTMLSDIRHVLL